MGDRTIPSVYLALKNVSSAWEARKRHFEKFSNLPKDEAREKILCLALHVINSLESLSVMIDEGELD